MLHWLLGFLPSHRPVSPSAIAHRSRIAERGVTALEFALVAPTAIFVLVFSIETGVMLMADATLGRVADNIARRVELNQLNGADCTTSIRTMLVTGMQGWVFNQDEFFVEEVQVFNPGDYGDPTDAAAPASTPPRCLAADSGGMVLYRLGFNNPGFSGIFKLLNIKALRFERHIVVQNLP